MSVCTVSVQSNIGSAITLKKPRDWSVIVVDVFVVDWPLSVRVINKIKSLILCAFHSWLCPLQLPLRAVYWHFAGSESQQHHLFMLSRWILCAILTFFHLFFYFYFSPFLSLDASICTEKRFAYFYVFRTFYGVPVCWCTMHDACIRIRCHS